jgi:sulfur-oxidizing protein SoxZ
MSARVVVSVPQSAKRGEIIEIRTLAGHEMETGFRRTQLGELVPRNIITRFACLYNGVEVFSAELHPAVAANPLIAFSTVATESGTLEFRWSGDNGYSASQSAQITVV